jgi:hypothetical protein
MAFDSQRGVVVLHGGRDLSNNEIVFNDTWEWDGTNWLLRSTSGPARTGHAMTYDSLRGVSVLHGGEDASISVRTPGNGMSDCSRAVDAGPSIGGSGWCSTLAGSWQFCSGLRIHSVVDEWTWDGLV